MIDKLDFLQKPIFVTILAVASSVGSRVVTDKIETVKDKAVIEVQLKEIDKKLEANEQDAKELRTFISNTYVTKDQFQEFSEANKTQLDRMEQDIRIILRNQLK
jgi:hypothetical protein